MAPNSDGENCDFDERKKTTAKNAMPLVATTVHVVNDLALTMATTAATVMKIATSFEKGTTTASNDNEPGFIANEISVKWQ